MINNNFTDSVKNVTTTHTRNEEIKIPVEADTKTKLVENSSIYLNEIYNLLLFQSKLIIQQQNLIDILSDKQRKPSSTWADVICMKNSSPLKRLSVLGMLVLILLFFVGVLLTLLDENKYEIKDYDENFKDHDYGDHLGNHKILYRKDWGGSCPRKNTTLMKHPSSLVIISHSTTRYCDTFDSCSKITKRIQKRHMSRPFSKVDIGYNFIIGGDGDIYVGRGWDIKNYHRRESIDIDFIGDYAFDELTPSMINATKLLIDQGIQLNKISEDYVIVGENQTNSKMYLSPGENAYKIIKDWPHFFNHTMF